MRSTAGVKPISPHTSELIESFAASPGLLSRLLRRVRAPSHGVLDEIVSTGEIEAALALLTLALARSARLRGPLLDAVDRVVRRAPVSSLVWLEQRARILSDWRREAWAWSRDVTPERVRLLPSRPASAAGAVPPARARSRQDRSRPRARWRGLRDPPRGHHRRALGPECEGVSCRSSHPVARSAGRPRAPDVRGAELALPTRTASSGRARRRSRSLGRRHPSVACRGTRDPETAARATAALTAWESRYNRVFTKPTPRQVDEFDSLVQSANVDAGLRSRLGALVPSLRALSS
jgi:hypothetical protein